MTNFGNRSFEPIQLTFDIVDPAEFTHLSLQILRDDGAIVYLNGVEIARSNMPDGPVDYYTPARRATSDESRWRGDGGDGDDFSRIDAGLLVAGSNRLAVEIPVGELY